MAPAAADFTDAVLQEVLTRMKANKDYKKATEDTDITKPAKLTDLVKWIKFWELFTTYLSRIKGATLITLTYLLREHEVVTQKMLNVDFPTMQERLIATTALSGAHFELDNCTLYAEFKPLVVDGPG